jgi:hypothetical protein
MPSNPKSPLTLCVYCQKPVELENAETDENGKAIHPECYLLRLRANRDTSPP